ncbi:MAG: hypothetical protein ACREFR_07330 [Limisphaerales bacterium]
MSSKLPALASLTNVWLWLLAVCDAATPGGFARVEFNAATSKEPIIGAFQGIHLPAAAGRLMSAHTPGAVIGRPRCLDDWVSNDFDDVPVIA